MLHNTLENFAALTAGRLGCYGHTTYYGHATYYGHTTYYGHATYYGHTTYYGSTSLSIHGHAHSTHYGHTAYFGRATFGSTVRVTDGKRTHLLDVLDVEGARDYYCPF